MACLLCLLSEGANPCLTAHISLHLQTPFGKDDLQDVCTHEELTPIELLSNVPEDVVLGWPEQVRTGWQLFCYILKASQNEWMGEVGSRAPVGSEDEDMPDFNPADFHAFTRQDYDTLDTSVPEDSSAADKMSLDGDDIDDSNDSYSSEDERMSLDNLPLCCSEDEDHSNFFGRNKDLATLWAAVQTELVSYRRLEEGDSWNSQNFNMASILEQVNSRERISIGLHELGMMKDFCNCGKFVDAEDYACTRVDEACSFYFSNMEDWSRTTHIGIP